jgi:glycosyltransferase involved in cell wall biosynthesis
MKILSVNKYFYPRGGAENSFFSRNETLKLHGHEVVEFSMQNPRNFESQYQDFFVPEVDYNSKKSRDRLSAALSLLYSFKSNRKLSALLAKTNPVIANVHNIYHQISPAIFNVLQNKKIPIILTLHDYKTVCASYNLLCNGKICESCKGGRYYNCFINNCVRGSRYLSFLNTVEMHLHHNILKLYGLVDVFISPSMFLIRKVKEMGFKGKIVHLFHCIDVKKYQPNYSCKEDSIVYFGRLSAEKGIGTLIQAMQPFPRVTLKIIGEGPLRAEFECLVNKLGLKNVKFLGYRVGGDLNKEILGSMFLVQPSEWYENNPRSVIEGFALGKPAIGARIGGIPELVKESETGLTFETGNINDLSSKIEMLLKNKEKIIEMGKNAREFVERELNYEVHYEKFIKICNDLLNKNV